MSELQLAMTASGDFLANPAHIWLILASSAFASRAKSQILATNRHEVKNPETLARRVSGLSGEDVIRTPERIRCWNSNWR